ncbi:MAG TPA: hypothetical protein PLQ13_05905 [Candidatus Krumholzibacteria bacterium]|nr:hypothetical protein [Candidatus Krumholzibacteria bacterium]
MKRTMILLALLAALMVAASADAGMFRKPKKQEPKAELEKSWRYDRLPTMAFTSGELAMDGYGNWKVGNVRVVLSPACTISGAGEHPQLAVGQSVTVMGPRTGGTMVAWQVQVQRTPRERSPRTQDTDIRWSDSDPAVGVGQAPN